jgi:hypothetical protein
MVKGTKYDTYGVAKYNPWIPDYVRDIVAIQRVSVKAINRLQLALKHDLAPLSKLSAEEDLKYYKTLLSKLNAYIDLGEHDAPSALVLFSEVSIDQKSGGAADTLSLQ